MLTAGYAVPPPMAGLVSPRPVSYNSYNPYARNVPPPYPESPASVGPMAIHTPGQSIGGYPGTSPAIPIVAHEEQKVYGLVIDLLSPEKRESALLELSKKREQYDDLALVLWHSFGVCQFKVSSSLCVYHPVQVSCQPCCRRLSLFILYYRHRISPRMPQTVSATRLRFSNA